MNTTNYGIKEKIISTVAFIVMITSNYLANALPYNKVTSAQVSDSYPNLFAPAGITFAVWGVIYLFVLGFIVYQFIFSKNNNELFFEILPFFVISSIANAVWLLSWHYRLIPVSLVLMLIILFCLIRINLKFSKKHFVLSEYIFMKLPFSIYFGWITVATIANVTALLVSVGWDRFGYSETAWMILILFVGTFIASVTSVRLKNYAYCLTVIWGYTGILIKHISSSGFNFKYPQIIFSVVICLALLFLSEFLIFKNKSKKVIASNA